MLKSLGKWIVVGLLLAGAFTLVSGWNTRDMLSASGDVAISPTTLPTLSGERATLGPDPARNTLVYFFAPWCSICRMSIGNLEAINEKDTQIFVIALDYATIQDVQQFARGVGLNRTVLLGNDELREFFKIKGYPSYYLLDTQFHIVSRDMGYTSELGLRRRAWQTGW